MIPDLNEIFSWSPAAKFLAFAVIVAAVYFLVYRLPIAVVRRLSFRCPHCNARCSKHASSCPHCGGNLSSCTSSETGAAIRQSDQGPQQDAYRWRTVLATLGGVLTGPFAGFFVAWWLYSLVGPHNSCMWWFEAFAWSLFGGAPVGLVTFAVIGFWVGDRLDRKAKLRLSDEGNSQLGA
jgi:hypothetical protein